MNHAGGNVLAALGLQDFGLVIIAAQTEFRKNVLAGFRLLDFFRSGNSGGRSFSSGSGSCRFHGLFGGFVGDFFASHSKAI